MSKMNDWYVNGQIFYLKQFLKDNNFQSFDENAKLLMRMLYE